MSRTKSPSPAIPRSCTSSSARCISRVEKGASRRSVQESDRAAPRSADSFARLSDLDLAAGRSDRALAIAESFVESSIPRTEGAHSHKASRPERKGDRKRAKGGVRGCAHRRSTVLRRGEQSCDVARQDEDSASGRALELAEMAKAASPDDPRSPIRSAGSSTSAATTRARWSCSRRQLARCRAPTVAYHLGVARLKAGDAAGARDALNRALRSQSAFPERGGWEGARFTDMNVVARIA